MDEHDQIMTFDGSLSFRRCVACITSSTLFDAAAAAAYRWLQDGQQGGCGKRQPRGAKKRWSLFKHSQTLFSCFFFCTSFLVQGLSATRDGMGQGLPLEFLVSAPRERERAFLRSTLFFFSFSFLLPPFFPVLYGSAYARTL